VTDNCYQDSADRTSTHWGDTRTKMHNKWSTWVWYLRFLQVDYFDSYFLVQLLIKAAATKKEPENSPLRINAWLQKFVICRYPLLPRLSTAAGSSSSSSSQNPI
jgi:hypothetical protein